MQGYTDTATGFSLGNPGTIPLSDSLPSRESVEAAFKPLILSASGWRKVFAESGNEEDNTHDIGLANTVLAIHMAAVFADWLLSRPSASKEIVLGYDTRPTGPAMADAMCRTFAAKGFSVIFLGTSAAPEIMAYAREHGAFAYISASHNPIGHNGVKFGLSDGGVLDGKEAAVLIGAFRTALAAPDSITQAQKLAAACPKETLAAILDMSASRKADALRAYTDFTALVISDESEAKPRDAFFGRLKKSADCLAEAGTPLSVVADFNGSARAASIDRAFLESCGIVFSAINDTPGAIAHRIVPEGSSLDFCADEIARMRREGTTTAERNAVLGYVPDCDGDRGNIVYWDEGKGKACLLEAQEVFALSVIAELTHLTYRDARAAENAAIAVNDPTSLRIEEIAEAFGAQVKRAEVGEANVVNLARALRGAGKTVRILGEGSNGGNITHPAAVRDPLNTVFAILKLLIIRDEGEKKGLFHLWCDRSGQGKAYRDNFTLADILATLPAYVTTSVYEKDAMLGIKTADHALLKRRFQQVFAAEWEKESPRLSAERGIASWIAIANNGTEQTEGLSDFGLSGKGGLKVQFLDGAGDPIAYIWMRGSGTEPVFRILADAKGSDIGFERELLGWLARMVLEADGKI